MALIVIRAGVTQQVVSRGGAGSNVAKRQLQACSRFLLRVVPKS